MDEKSLLKSYEEFTESSFVEFAKLIEIETNLLYLEKNTWGVFANDQSLQLSLWKKLLTKRQTVWKDLDSKLKMMQENVKGIETSVKEHKRFEWMDCLEKDTEIKGAILSDFKERKRRKVEELDIFRIVWKTNSVIELQSLKKALF
eukprot:snap_masked-scaffold_1-processed-gene-31.7-mRNA-1 protein AED:1.00 eAED:1.00 QI:0/-1/0/0/-1/1/1/0/145